MSTDHEQGTGLARRLAWVSLAAALVILGLKAGAYFLTGSVGFLSDAAESVVNLVSAVVLLLVLRASMRPPDYEHPYGHTKAEYLSAVLEAALIIVAAVLIAWSAVDRLLRPQELTNVLLGTAVAGLAAAVNGVLAFALYRVGVRERSAALEANSRHLLTDVYTSLGVIFAVIVVSLTGWNAVDPIVALLVAANIVRVGYDVMRRSVSNLLDERLPDGEEAVIIEALEAEPQVLGFHRLRTRRSGRARFAEVDVFVEPTMSVADAHVLVGRVEDAVHEKLGELVTTVHVEPFVAGVRDGRTTPREEFSD